MYAKDLREESGRISAQMHAIVNGADKVKGLTSEEAVKYDALEADYGKLEKDIQRAEASAARELSLAASASRLIVPAVDAVVDPKIANMAKLNSAFSNFLRNGEKAIAQEESALLKQFSNTMSTTTGSQGGYTVPVGFEAQLEAAMKWFGGSDAFGTFTTSTGNSLTWPTQNDTSNTGRIIGQNVQVTQTDFTFGQVTFGSFIFSSDLTLIPWALVQDSAFDLDSYLANALGTRLGRILNTKFTVGAGTTEPTGIVTAAVAAGNTLTLGVGNTLTLSFDNLTDLEHKVDPSYRDGSKYMFHDSTLQYLKKLKDDNNRPLWLPALTGSSGDKQNAGTINGYNYVINNDMAAIGVSAKSVLFGDLTKYKMRRVASTTEVVVRLNERYADYLQTGYFAYLRADGNLLDAGTHPVAVLIQSAT